MDISDIFKSHFANLYKATGPTKTIEERKIDLKNERKSKRDTLALTKRNININMSPFTTPRPSETITNKKMSKPETKTTEMSEGVSKKLEMLAKWKADKAKRKEQERAHKKPIFKVCHVAPEVSVDLENVYRNIKGKPIAIGSTKKSQFAPDNHQFRPPNGIKPVNFPTICTRSKISETVRKAIAQPIKERPRKLDRPKSKVRPAQKPNRIGTPSVPKGSDCKTLQSVITNRDIILKDKPVTISPFVTVLRGKRNAIDKENLPPLSPEKPNNPETRATDYFENKLASETNRINKLCEKWQIYLQNSTVPEEPRSLINAAIGQSRLLIAKKFEQFRGLVTQCKTQRFKEKSITCEDLHGFWDMVYMQVEDLDKRFSNLDKLKENNWVEILPEKKVPVKRTRTRAKKMGGTSRLKDMIQAAREKNKADKETISNDNETGAARRITPLRERSENALTLREPLLIHQTADDKNKVRLSVLTRSRVSSSPGLTMMKVSQSIKQGNGLTPAKGILRVDKGRSTGKKSVAFLDTSSSKNLTRTTLFVEEAVCVENERVVNYYCLRRSARLSKHS